MATKQIVKKETAPLSTMIGEESLKEASRYASILVEVVKRGKLAVRIQGREYIQCEGWTTLAKLVGYVPTIIEVHGSKSPMGYVARAGLRNIKTGTIEVEAESACFREGAWKNREWFALRSMAQTRAVAKACRIALSYIVALAGYAPTPAEEMPFAPKEKVATEQEAEEEDFGWDEAPEPEPAPAKKKKYAKKLTTKQIKLLYAKAKEAGRDPKELPAIVGKQHFSDLNWTEMDTILNQLENGLKPDEDGTITLDEEDDS